MKTLLSIALLTSACLGFSAQASELDEAVMKSMQVQMAKVNQELTQKVSRDIQFSTQVLTVPVVEESETLVAKAEIVTKKNNNGE